MQNLFRIPGGASRETWPFDARWREGGSEVSRALALRLGPAASLLTTYRDTEFRVMDALRMPAGVTGWADGVGTN